jgi:hypothetical protein
MLWIVKEGLRNASRRADCIEVNRGALTLQLNDGLKNTATRLITLIGGQAHNGLCVALERHHWPPRFFPRFSAGSSGEILGNAPMHFAMRKWIELTPACTRHRGEQGAP